MLTLLPYDIADRFLALFVTLPTALPPLIVPSGCIGPSYSLVVDGGTCIVVPDTGEVQCIQPSITLVAKPLTCNLLYRCVKGPPAALTRIYPEL